MKVELDASGAQFGLTETVRVLKWIPDAAAEHEVLEMFTGLPWLTKCRARRWCRRRGYTIVR